MLRARFPVVVAVVVVVAVLPACLEPPGVGRAADPSHAPGPAPWGSATSNAELDKKINLLNDILDAKVQAVDLPARVEKDWPDMSADERKKGLGAITQLMEELRRAGQAGKRVEPGPDRDMAIAQLYFGERRFIEAAEMLSKILDVKPTYPGARNLLARCFFFLQNRDRTILELEWVLANPEQQKDRGEVLDALFLMGAAVAETPGMSRANLEKGLHAWETYLKLSPESPQKAQVERGLDEIRAGLRGEGRLAQPLVPTTSSSDDGAGGGGGAGNKGVMGGPAARRPMGPNASAAPAGPRESRVAKLKADASPAERALAEGLDALEAKDLATASTKLSAAQSSSSGRALSEARVGLGRVAVQSGKIDDALRLFGEVIKVDPEFSPAWHYLGMAHMMSGSPDQAVSAWQKIVDKDPAYAKQFRLDQRIEVAKRMSGK